jgi:hypothetical protein
LHLYNKRLQPKVDKCGNHFEPLLWTFIFNFMNKSLFARRDISYCLRNVKARIIFRISSWKRKKKKEKKKYILEIQRHMLTEESLYKFVFFFSLHLCVFNSSYQRNYVFIMLSINAWLLLFHCDHDYITNQEQRFFFSLYDTPYNGVIITKNSGIAKC